MCQRLKVQPSHCPWGGAPSYHMCLYTTSSSRPWNRSTNGTGPSTPVTSTAPSSSTIGSRRRAAAIASPSRVCAFSRTSSSSRAACQVARSTTGGLPGRLLLALPGVVVEEGPDGVSRFRPALELDQFVQEALVLDVLQKSHHLRMRADRIGDVQE